MGNPAKDVSNWVVKHTFIEWVGETEALGGRPRAVTDQFHTRFDVDLLDGVGLLALGRASMPPQTEESPTTVLPIHNNGMEQEPKEVCWPTTPVLEAIFEPQRDVKWSSLEELQNVDGASEGTNSGAWFQTTSQEESPTPLNQSQPSWFYMPYTGGYQDCAAGYWNQQQMWYPQQQHQQSASWTATKSDFGAQASTATASPVATSDRSDSFDAGSDHSASVETRTTVMLRNLPQVLTREVLLRILESLGFAGKYDLVYIPVDFSVGRGLGYAFINVASPVDVPQLWDMFDGYSSWDEFGIVSQKVCGVSWSDPHQGLASHVERYQNSPVMHPDVPDEWKPALFRSGVRIDFPAPTKRIKAPKVRSTKRHDMLSS